MWCTARILGFTAKMNNFGVSRSLPWSLGPHPYPYPKLHILPSLNYSSFSSISSAPSSIFLLCIPYSLFSPLVFFPTHQFNSISLGSVGFHPSHQAVTEHSLCVRHHGRCYSGYMTKAISCLHGSLQSTGERGMHRTNISRR